MTEKIQNIALNQNDYEIFMRGMHLLPLKRNGKAPFMPNGHLGVLKDNNIYDFPAHGYNVGLSLSLANLCCIDVDENHGEDCHGLAELTELEAKLGNLPRTLMQQTPNGGIHLIFTDEGVVEHPIGKLAPSIDFKRQGYIVVCPSVIDGKQYEIIDTGSDNGFHIGQLPQAWLDKVNRIATNRKSVTRTNINDKSKKTKKYNKTINIERMFSDCNFLKYCRDNAAILSEPMWYSMVTELAMIEGAEFLIHELSKPYPQYSYAETQKKIENARKFGFPQSCEYISATYPEVCGKCEIHN